MGNLEKVLNELSQYAHPFFEFSAVAKDDGVEVQIRSKIPNVLSPEYRITISVREIQHPQFPWTFQRLLYDCLTDYVVELFTKTPATSG